MKIKVNHKIKWKEREKLRDKGQFWTPEWVASAMIAYVSKGAKEVFDPGVGNGIFYTALKKYNQDIRFYGTDIDVEIIEKAKKEGIFDNNSTIEIRDFILTPPKNLFKAIVANPPYIRHHRFSVEVKKKAREITLKIMHKTIDGRAGIHIYFLIQSLNLLDKGGRLAFIMPADTCEGVFSKSLWEWITKKYCLEGVITFTREATPFPGIDTNAIIFLISNSIQKDKVKWIKCLKTESKDLFHIMNKQLIGSNYQELAIYKRDISEALLTGLSREPREFINNRFTLGDFARVMRGIATGANEFFFLTHKKVKELGIPDKFLLQAIGRTRDIEDSQITQEIINTLDKKGRPTLLFSPNGYSFNSMPEAVRSYILEGEKMGLPNRALISTRQPWYKMEVRETPAFLFSYLGRRNTRFIKNEAGIIPLTAHLCIYPKTNGPVYIEKLWNVLQHPDTLKNLSLVGKSYGSGAIKVEPRALERLPIPDNVLELYCLEPNNAIRDGKQLSFLVCL